jgi:hypothetical protein
MEAAQAGSRRCYPDCMLEHADRLEQTLSAAHPRLAALTEEAASARSAQGAWSKKEELGHLIDSAANNHQRFVRLQNEALLALPGYAPDEWNRVQHYRERAWTDLIEFWMAYNRHLAHVIRHADPTRIENRWRSPKDGDLTLLFIVTDYLSHLDHHLSHILGQHPQPAQNTAPL